MTSPHKGDLAPAFTVAGETESISLSDYAGKTLVLYFYPKDDTPGCTSEAKDFSALAASFAAAGAYVLGISRDSITAHGKFRTKHGLTIDLGADIDGAVTEAYGVWVEKNMYGRKYMGIERSTFLIDPQGRIAQVWHKVKVPGHAAQVLRAAQLLG